MAYVLKCATTIESVKAAEQAGEEAKVVSGIDTAKDGINYVIYNDFENILSPRNVTPVD